MKAGGTSSLGRSLLLAVLALAFLAPLAFLVAGSLQPEARLLARAGTWRAVVPDQPGLAAYREVLQRVAFGRFLLNSLVVTLGVVLGGLVINAPAGYAFARLRWRGRGLLLGVVLALLVLPFEAVAVPLFHEVTLLGWRDSYHVQIVPFLANAFSIFLFYSFFLGLPRSLEDAARVDGAGPWRTFLAVVVPQSRPAFATCAILTFLVQWGSYLWPLMVTAGPRYRPLPVAIAVFQTVPPVHWSAILAFGVLMVAPVVAVFLLFQRWFVASVSATGVKG